MATVAERRAALSGLTRIEKAAANILDSLHLQRTRAVLAGNDAFADQLEKDIRAIERYMQSIQAMKTRIRGARSVTQLTQDLDALSQRAEAATASFERIAELLKKAKTIVEILKTVSRIALV